MTETQHNQSGDEAPPRTDRWAAGVLTATAGVLTGLIRLVPHPGNFTSVGALGLFSGARLGTPFALAVPLVVMIASDCALWLLWGPMYSPLHESRIWVYGSYMLYVPIGWALARTHSVARIGAAAVCGSMQFFLITNYYSWLTDATYARDFGGLMMCYLAGLPFYNAVDPLGFFGRTLVGDVGFTAILFGAYAWLARTAPVPKPAAAADDRR
jgi:hypothetical protein